MSDIEKCNACGDDVPTDCPAAGEEFPMTMTDLWEEEFEGPAPDCLDIFANVVPGLMAFMSEGIVRDTPALAAINLRIVEDEIRAAIEVLESLAMYRREHNANTRISEPVSEPRFYATAPRPGEPSRVVEGTCAPWSATTTVRAHAEAEAARRNAKFAKEKNAEVACPAPTKTAGVSR